MEKVRHQDQMNRAEELLICQVLKGGVCGLCFPPIALGTLIISDYFLTLNNINTWFCLCKLLSVTEHFIFSFQSVGKTALEKFSYWWTYYNNPNNHMIMFQKKIVINYCWGWFIVDMKNKHNLINEKVANEFFWCAKQANDPYSGFTFRKIRLLVLNWVLGGQWKKWVIY